MSSNLNALPVVVSSNGMWAVSVMHRSGVHPSVHLSVLSFS